MYSDNSIFFAYTRTCADKPAYDDIWLGVQVKRVDPFTAEVILGVTSEGSLCSGSSDQGILQVSINTRQQLDYI